MAFVRIEDKTDEVEFIVFPSIFAECGGKLVVDNVVKVRGKVNATDKDGRISSEIKILAENVEVILDETLESYMPTGKKLAKPVTVSEDNKQKTSAEYVRNRGDGAKKALNNLPKTEKTRILKEPPKDTRKERLYILIENIDDAETLTAIRHLADLNPGFQEVVLVIREGDSKRPLRMPFKVEVSDELLSKLYKLVGEERVKVR